MFNNFSFSRIDYVHYYSFGMNKRDLYELETAAHKEYITRKARRDASREIQPLPNMLRTINPLMGSN